MVPERAVVTRSTPRTRLAAISFGATAFGYWLLSVFYFWEDFFRHADRATAMVVDKTGFVVPTSDPYVWTILSPWRVLGAALAVCLLGASAVALWRNRPRARVLALISVWGVLIPQVFWYTEFLSDWHQGHGIGLALTAAMLIGSALTMLLLDREPILEGWGREVHRRRLIASGILFAGLGFLATEIVDHSYQIDSMLAYGGALVAIPLALLAVVGVYQLRAWGIVAGLGAAASLALVPLAAIDTSFYYTGGTINGFARAATASPVTAVITAALPIAAVVAVTAPFLRAFARELHS